MASSSSRKVHNSSKSLQAKVELRRLVLGQVRPAHVLEAFCGPVGEMWAAWKDASSYLGIDREWKITDRRRRMVCDNRIALRALDLQQFNVFDLDAFGDPWEQAIIVAACRRWAPGEVGALVLTDGGGIHSSRIGASNVIVELVGQTFSRGNMKADVLCKACERRILRRMRVDVTSRWQATSKNRNQIMRYTAIVFRGQER